MSGEKASMRELMPETARWIDELRQQFGREVIDPILLKAKRGQGGFWVREQCPDGVVREFGSRGQE